MEIEPTGTVVVGPCECCGDDSRTVRGFMHGDPEAAYAVHWTVGKVDQHGAHFDLILAESPDRIAVSLEFRMTDNGPAFMVIDANGRPVSKNPVVDRSLRRQEVVGTAVATTVFKIVDAIWLNDGRLAELRGDAA